MVTHQHSDIQRPVAAGELPLNLRCQLPERDFILRKPFRVISCDIGSSLRQLMQQNPDISRKIIEIFRRHLLHQSAVGTLHGISAG